MVHRWRSVLLTDSLPPPASRVTKMARPCLPQCQFGGLGADTGGHTVDSQVRIQIAILHTLSGARVPNGRQDFLAILELVDELLIELGLFRISNRGSESLRHDLAERPSSHLVVLVDMSDQESMGRENNF